MSEENLYNYLDIIEDIEENTNKTKKQEYVAIIRVREAGTWNIHHFLAGIIRASDDSIAFLLSKKYCHKIADFLVNMTCDPYRVITTEEAMKTITITRTKEEYDDEVVDVVTLNIDGDEILVNSKDFPGSEPTEKMPLLEAIIKYPAIVKYI